MGAGMRLVWLLIHLEAVTCQLLSIDDTIQLVIKQQTKYLPQPQNYSQRIDLFVPQNDYTDSELDNLNYIYHVIIVPPTEPLRWQAQSASAEYRAGPSTASAEAEYGDRFLETRYSRIHFSLLCSEGIPLLREDDQPKKCDPNSRRAEDSCPTNFWCHMGNSLETNFCCPSNRKIPNLCHLPPNSGYGNDKLTRYWHDWRAGFCREMIYSGFGGNQNCFLTRNQCEKRCAGTPKPTEAIKKVIVEQKKTKPEPLVTTTRTPPATFPPKTRFVATTAALATEKDKQMPKPVNPCSFPPDKGQKTARKPSTRWFFDLATERCIHFEFQGAGGNANNFHDEHSCVETCGGGPRGLSSCQFPLEVGIGGHAIPRYYYNSQTKSCRKFVYRGSGGNPNRFVTRSACGDTCIKGVSSAKPKLTFSSLKTATTTNSSESAHSSSSSSGSHNDTSNPLPETTKMIKTILEDLDKFTLSPDPFAPPPGASTTTASPLTTSTDTVAAKKVAQVFEKLSETESESSVDPFEMQTATPLYPQFPLTRPPADDSFEEDGEDTDVSDGPVVFPGFPPTTTAYPVDYPTLVSVTQDKKETSNEGFRQGVLSPFQAHFAKHVGVTVSPDSVQPQLPYGVTAKLTPQSPNLSNVFHLTQNGHMAPPGSTSPCSFASADTTSTMVRGCHPGGASTSGFSTWSQECPPSSFCQVGETTHLSFCCPRLGGSPCLQPRTPGVGGAQLRRWHFDVASRQCKGFIFHGFQGNENNYLSHESCRQACQASNPCPYGEPYGFESVASGQPCSTTAPSCPIHFYCHVQSPESPSAVCCPLFNGTLTGTPQIVDLSASSSGGTESSGPSIAHAHGASHSYPQPFGGPSTAPDTAGSHGSPLVGDSMGRRRGFNPFTSSAAAASFAFPCTMPIARGTGSAQLHRWGYSPSAKACITFVFSGAGGNNNNFLTKSDCIHACMATLNPCGGPVHALDGTRYQRCTTSHTCPIGQYCHLGSTEEANVCCPSSLVNPCLLSLSVGLGSASLHRYYFDGVTSTCKPFSYTGVAGNENNFRTIQDCRRACPEYDNPCQKGTPAVNPADGSVYFCSTSNQKCPRGHFCHIGDTRQTSVCCKNVGNQCSSYVLLGSGTAQLPRYYYNQKTRTCVPFAYSGKGGNSNNFVSKIECETACPVVDNPCATGFPALDTYGEPVLCSTAEPDICSKHGNYWCHISSTQSATVCCPGKTDPCKLPMSRGTGTAVLNRWYFNAESKVCVSFVYSGREGNQNNYMSRSQCIEACPEFLSPCPVGQPHIGLSGQITHCGAAEPSICPTTYWCHIGSTLDNSVCCPHSSDPCEQHKEVGTGSSQLLRYHYNQLARTCTQFRYSGLGGNENNFLTKQACEARCPVFSSPCAAGAPQMDENLTPMACSAADGTSCAPGFWCHVGSNEQSTICCSGSAENVCEEPLVIGNGDASLPRHYFNGLTKQCLPFVYSGRSGNQNNFLSKAACEESCETMRNPCAGGDPATGANGMYITCSTSSPNVCPSSFFCHHGIDLSESVCCPGGEQDPCALPVEVGEGDHSLTRFYFDPNLRRCTKFNYSSIGGNSNNFLTLQDCQLKCPEFQSPCSTGEPAQAPGGGILFCSQSRQTCPSSYWCHIGDPAEETTVCCPGKNDPCLLPMLPGSSGSKLTRFYFNQNTRQCLQFTYTGSGGNSNNFLSEADCASKCPVFRNPCPNAASNNQMAVTHCSAQNPQTCRSGHWCHLGVTSETTVCCAGASDPCRLRPSQGIIDLNGGPVTRWHYDLSSRKCKAFQYGGTAGNENNFLTREDCAQRCTEFVNTCFTGEPLMDPSTGTVRLCNAAGSVECPRNYFCLIGSSAQSSVCCPLEGRDPCTQALAVGTGALTLPRWYFNYQTKQCQEFVYSGVSGNANNFISRAACAHQCPEFVRAPPTADRRWEVASSNNPCLLPASSGSGRYSLVRFYYNPNTRQCEDFIYSGAGGNGNNFVSLQACRQTCQEASFGGNSMNPFLPPAVASAIRSPFGSRMGSHRGNDDGVPQMGRPLCPQGEPLTAPDGSPVVCSIHEANSCQKHDYRCTMTSSGQSYCCLDSRYFCLQPRQTISCPYRQQLMQVKYGYDPRTDTCQPVNGCGGSVNNFGSYVECSQSCCNKGYNLLVKFNDADFMHSNAMTEDDVDSSDKKPDMDKQFDEASDSEATTTARHRLEIDGHFHVDDDDEIYEEESRPTLPRILRIW